MSENEELLFYLANVKEGVFDPSCVKTFLDCRRKFYWKDVCGYVSEKTDVHLSFGKAVHSGIEQIHNNASSAEVSELVMKEMDGAEEHDKKTAEKALETVALYRDYLKLDTAKTLDYLDEAGEVKKAIEIEFSLDMPNGTILAGRIDRVIDLNGLIYVEDYKTTSQYSANWARRWYNNFSLMAYAYAVKRIVGVCHGVRITQFHIIKGVSQRRIDSQIVLNFNPNISDRFEEQYVLVTNEIMRLTKGWDIEAMKDSFYMCNSDTNCYQYYKSCPYLGLCMFGERAIESEGLIKQEPVRRK